MDIAIKFGQNLKKLRLSKRLSQGQLAKRLRVSPSYISQIERGFQNMSLRGIEKLAKALETPIGKLIK